ncbi:MAG: hypothetical protein WC299_06325 [Kiritimatiellia bacterium]
MKARSYLVLVLALAALTIPAGKNASAAGRARGADTFLIVPARPGILNLAFDMEYMRDVTVVSFRTPAAPARGKAAAHKAAAVPAQTLIHVWSGREWQYVPLDDFCMASFAGASPKKAILVGDDQTVPKSLLQGMVWPCKVERLTTLDTAVLLNGLDKHFEFSSREWKSLADKYNLHLEDVNAPRREFNYYTVPRSKLPLETHEFKQEKGEAPPAVLIEKPESQAPARDTKPAEKPWIK